MRRARACLAPSPREGNRAAGGPRRWAPRSANFPPVPRTLPGQSGPCEIDVCRRGYACTYWRNHANGERREERSRAGTSGLQRAASVGKRAWVSTRHWAGRKSRPRTHPPQDAEGGSGRKPKTTEDTESTERNPVVLSPCPGVPLWGSLPAPPPDAAHREPTEGGCVCTTVRCTFRRSLHDHLQGHTRGELRVES